MVLKLRVLAGTSETMTPITSLVNTNKAHKLSSDVFEGEIVAHIKNFSGEDGAVQESEYFSREDRQGVTWSIQVRGRFLVPHSADDILFGNTFDRPLKLPWGTGAVLKFMNYIDPTLRHDLQSSSKPWALSPLVSTMPHLMHQRLPDPDSPFKGDSPLDRKPSFPSTRSITDWTPDIYQTLRERAQSPSSISSSSTSSSASSFVSTKSAKSNTSSRSSSKKSDALKGAFKKAKSSRSKRESKRHTPENLRFDNASARRAFFSNAANRQSAVFGPQDIITTDFCYGFIEFSPSLALRLPGGLSFDLMRYWDGQPVKFVCCKRKPHMDGDEDREPWGRIFWCIAIESYEDEGV